MLSPYFQRVPIWLDFRGAVNYEGPKRAAQGKDTAMCILRLRPHSWQPGPAENSSGVCRHAARLFVVALLCLLSPQLGWAQAVLENPQPASFQSGIGLISGWACEATSIEIQFDRRLPVEAASGTDRGDTRGAMRRHR